MGAFDADKFRAELERDGLGAVKEKLARRLYSDGKWQYAKKWVAEKEHQISAKRYEQDRETPWRETLRGMIIIGFIIALGAGLCVAYVAHLFGWI